MKSIFVALLGIACLSMMSCEAKTNVKNSHQSKKTYVDPRDIRVSENGIFVLEKGRLVPVETISKDKGGLYIKRETPYIIECRTCGFKYNWHDHTHCPKCHRHQ